MNIFGCLKFTTFFLLFPPLLPSSSSLFSPCRAGGDHQLEGQLHQTGACAPEGLPPAQRLLRCVPVASARELPLSRPCGPLRPQFQNSCQPLHRRAGGSPGREWRGEWAGPGQTAGILGTPGEGRGTTLKT